MKNIDKLFQLIAQDLIKNEDGSGTISILSIHPSIKRRKLIDLQQTLQITAAFEFYVRKYLPQMVVEKDHHIIMKKFLKEIENKSTGKLKKLALSLSAHVIMEPSLEDKVVKAYNGFDSWKSLDSCIVEEWYKKEEIRELGKEINNWRNELAHEKRTYAPTVDTIRAVRLLEHINYSIVLRQIGFTDGDIKCYLESILERHFAPKANN